MFVNTHDTYHLSVLRTLPGALLYINITPLIFTTIQGDDILSIILFIIFHSYHYV